MVERWESLSREIMEFPSLVIFEPNWTQPWETCCSDCTLSRGVGLDNLQRSCQAQPFCDLCEFCCCCCWGCLCSLCFVTSPCEPILPPMDLPLPICQDHQTSWTAHLAGKHHHRAASLTFTRKKCSGSQKLLGRKHLPEIFKHLEVNPRMFFAAGRR